MKKLRNLFLALVLVLVSVFTVSVSAETGTIKIINAENGRKYDIFKIFDLTYSGSNVAYTINSDWVNFFNSTDGAEYIVSEKNGTPITIGTETKYINITESNVAEFAQKALDYAAKNVDAVRSVEAKDDNLVEGNLVIDGLALGYYLVYPQGAVDKGSNGSIASLNSTKPTANINIKATYPTLTKDFDDNSKTSTYDQGEIARFKLTSKVPDTTGYSDTNPYIFIIHDEWQDGLALINGAADQFTVKIGDTTLDASQYDLDYAADGRKFALTLDVTTNNSSIVGQPIIVTYGLVVTEKAIVDSDYNKARLQYSNNPKDTNEETKYSYTGWDFEYVYSSKIVVTKVDGADTTNNTKLAGATFVLKNIDGKYYYYNTSLGKVEWVDTEALATKLTTELPTGEITFAGIKDGTYTLVETVAPLGFNKLPTDIPITISGAQKITGVEHRETVQNFSGAQLPSTGGFGTKLFIIIGSLLAMISGVVLVTNKRMAKEEM